MLFCELDGRVLGGHVVLGVGGCEFDGRVLGDIWFGVLALRLVGVALRA